ncbi:MAG: hypothetical protein HDR88_14605 [Bacteroides sp.]|nr:hypothetical protein [Bacteroides sp.]
MNVVKIAGLTILALVWVWLCHALLFRGGGVTFKNIFLIGASGIIIFVPLWKKYFRQENTKK